MLHIIAKQSSCISLQHARSPHSLEGVGRSLDWKGQMPSTDILSDTVSAPQEETENHFFQHSVHLFCDGTW